MEPEKAKDHAYDTERLVHTKDGYYAVAVHHGHLDHLIGSLMHVLDMIGDSTQRDALKSEIKGRARDWLDDNYHAAGFSEEMSAPLEQ